jgi:hypothetical protein
MAESPEFAQLISKLTLGNDFQEPQSLQALLGVAIDAILALDLAALSEITPNIIPENQYPSAVVLDSFSNAIKADLLRACLLIFFLSLGKMVPRHFQLEAIAHTLTGQDGLVTAATGSGKTLIMAALSLLRPNDKTVLIVPLKRLQASQNDAFTRFNIPSIIINEDTPDDPELWKVSYTHLFLPADLFCRISQVENIGISSPRWSNSASLTDI